MNLTQMVSIAVVVGLVMLPSIIALYINGPQEPEAEPEYDYR
jgi:hypothetical protein